MTTTAYDDQFSAEPEPVHQPYDTGSILRRNVADLELALKQQTERAEAAEAELLAVREDNHSMMLEIDGLRKELAMLREKEPVAWDCGGSITANSGYAEWFSRKDHGAAVPLYTSPTPAPAVPEEWRKFVGFLAQQTTFPHPAVCICQACTWIKKARALLQSPDVKESLTSQADCRACVNRGRVNGLSQETYCEGCVHEGRNWRKNHFLDAAADRLLEKNRE